MTTPRKTQMPKTAKQSVNRAARRAAPKAKTNAPTEHVVRPRGAAERISELETKIDTLIWLHAEMSYSIRLAVAKQMVKSRSAEMEEEMLKQLMQGGGMGV